MKKNVLTTQACEYVNKQLLNVGYEKLLRQRFVLSHILREPNSIIVLLFICKYVRLRVNACIVHDLVKNSDRA